MSVAACLGCAANSAQGRLDELKTGGKPTKGIRFSSRIIVGLAVADETLEISKFLPRRTSPLALRHALFTMSFQTVFLNLPRELSSDELLNIFPCRFSSLRITIRPKDLMQLIKMSDF